MTSPVLATPHVSPTVWASTIALVAGLMLFDYVFHVRKAHVPSLRESSIWSALYVGFALLFGAAVALRGRPGMGAEYFAGYLTEKALSVDNVFVFLVIMSSFRVPRAYQQKALLFGIVFALAARIALIFVGAALIERFAAVFYLFGLLLLMTAGNLLKPKSEDKENFVMRLAVRWFPTSQHYDGQRLFTREEGRRVMTPLMLVMIVIGGTDVLFALDSIPAIFGLTQDTYIVVTATAFSLLGLRQLYFLIDHLLERLIYLPYGLAAILAFIGSKLILHALHENNLPFINDGAPVNVVEISTTTSLYVIGALLLVTVVASLTSEKGKARSAVANLRQLATEYLDLDEAVFAEERERLYGRLVAAEQRVKSLDEELRKFIRDREALKGMLARAHARHAELTGN
ncbi:MAG TPA: TerC family protein [Steroidobacteraceae bacterium]|nr:TerC family protein [Steroidobacteraceae bacterium]